MKRRRVIAPLVVIIVLLAFLMASSAYFLRIALNPGVPLQRDQKALWQRMYNAYPYLKAWHDSLDRVGALRDTSIVTADGRSLHAYYLRSEGAPYTAVLVHGYTRNAVAMMMLAEMYQRALGYNVLMPDLHAAGSSDGTYIRMGWLDRLDLHRWVEAAETLYGDTTRMVVHGISMGAATVMMMSGDSVPSSVRAYIEDCGYTSVWDEFEVQLKAQYHLPAFPLLYLADWWCQWQYGWSLSGASALRQVAKCRRPMLFIHGAVDQYVPTSMVYRLYDAKPEPKALWVVPDTPHARSYYLHRNAYRDRVRTFLSEWMTDDRD